MSPAAPLARRRRGRVQWVFAAAVIAAMVGILAIVGNSIHLLDRMTGDVAVAQRRAENLSNSQREILRLIQAVTDLASGSDPSDAKRAAVELRLGLFSRQFDVSHALFPAASREARETEEIKSEIAALDWPALASARPDTRRVRAVLSGLAAIERRVKALYDGQAKLFYSVTTQSLRAKEQGELALGGLVGLVAVLGFGWIVTIRRRSNSDLRAAYEALVVEMNDRRAAEEAVRTSERRFRSLVQRASDLTGVTDEHGVMTYVSPAVESVLGYAPEEFVGGRLRDRVHPDDDEVLAGAVASLRADPANTATVDFRIRARDGRWRNIEAVGRDLLEDNTIRGIVWNGRDVTDRRMLQDQLTYQAFHDALTSLPNRALLLDRLEQALATADSPDSVAVVLIDLDGFKSVNDRLGHQAGDELLRQVAARLKNCVRASDTAARLGGDEFAVVVEGRLGQDLARITDRILAAVREPVTVDGTTVCVGASIGVAEGDPDSTANDLLRDADIAMYAAKATGKNRVELFKPCMRDSTTERSALEQELVLAVERGQIEVFYQPIVELTDGRVLALEALARWRHPERGLVPPDVFIPIAEQAGLIVDLGRHMLFEACAAAARWRRDLPDHRDLGITVNVSGRQILSGDLAGHVVHALDAAGLPPSALTLEITESVLLDDTDAVREAFARLGRLGVHIAVDDFGAGYTSIGSLMRFSADVLKIDRSFLEFDTASQGSLVQAVSGLGQTLNLLVVAEGVETVEHLRRATKAGCHAAQGYWFARPAGEAETTLLLRRDPSAVGRLDELAGVSNSAS